MQFIGYTHHSVIHISYLCIFADEFTYSAALQDMPDLPRWLQIVHNPSRMAAYLYGTPNQYQESLMVKLLCTYWQSVPVTFFVVGGGCSYKSVYI